MRAAVVADGGPNVGLGHMGRCMALAQALKKVSGASPVFVTKDPLCARWVRQRGFPVKPSLKGESWDLIVADSYRFKRHELKTLRKAAKTLLTVDDFGNVRVPSDFVLNSAVWARKIRYPKRSGKLLLGSRYHPLRKEFWGASKRRKIRTTVRDILLILGGGDGWGLMDGVVRQVRAVLPQARIHLVSGPLSRKGTKTEDRNIIRHVAPKNLRGLMVSCDMAVSAGGQTLFELAFTGTPAVAVLIANNQKLNVAGFEAVGTILSTGFARHNDFDAKLRRAVDRLARSPRLRARMSAAGIKAVDGKGSLRVVEAIYGSV